MSDAELLKYAKELENVEIEDFTDEEREAHLETRRKMGVGLEYLNINLVKNRPYRLWKFSDEDIQTALQNFTNHSFAILTPCKTCFKNTQNNNRILELQDSIIKANLSYVPIYSGLLKDKCGLSPYYHFDTFFMIFNYNLETSQETMTDGQFHIFIGEQVSKFEISCFLEHEYNELIYYNYKYEELQKLEKSKIRNYNKLFLGLLKLKYNLDDDENFSRYSFESVAIPPFCNPPEINAEERRARKETYNEIILTDAYAKEDTILEESLRGLL